MFLMGYIILMVLRLVHTTTWFTLFVWHYLSLSCMRNVGYIVHVASVFVRLHSQNGLHDKVGTTYR